MPWWWGDSRARAMEGAGASGPGHPGRELVGGLLMRWMEGHEEVSETLGGGGDDGRLGILREGAPGGAVGRVLADWERAMAFLFKMFAVIVQVKGARRRNHRSTLKKAQGEKSMRAILA